LTAANNLCKLLFFRPLKRLGRAYDFGSFFNKEVIKTMPAHFSRRVLLGSAGAAALLSITGCTATASSAAKKETESPYSASFYNLGPRVTPATPEPGVKKIAVNVFDAFKGDGLWYFDDNVASQFIVSNERNGNGNRIIEHYRNGKRHGFTWGIGAVGIVRDGKRIGAQNPTALINAGDHVVLETSNQPEPLHLNLALEAYDVSGTLVREYLRTLVNMPTNAALFMGEQKFPKGSIAYAVTGWIDQDEVLAASANAFTGSDTIEAFSERFTHETPYCLRFLPGNEVQPLGLNFDKAIQKKQKVETVTVPPTRKGRRATKKKVYTDLPQSGTVKVYTAKKGTIFCTREGQDPVTTAKWDLGTKNGTRVLTLDFPRSVDPLSCGLTVSAADKLLVAFAEEKDSAGKTRVIPAYVWLKGAKIRDSQYRFNKTAADAITAAIKESSAKRAAWEQANESEVSRRARSLKAKEAASSSASAKKTTKRRVRRTSSKKTTKK
jgi:hypothetical protein